MQSREVSMTRDDLHLQANSNGRKYFSASVIWINCVNGLLRASLRNSAWLKYFKIIQIEERIIYKAYLPNKVSVCFFSCALAERLSSLSESIFSNALVRNMSAERIWLAELFA